MRPKFPLMRLPLELRQQILLYLLPYAQEQANSPSPLALHALNFGAVKKRIAKGMDAPVTSTASISHSQEASISNIVWQPGNTKLFAVCRQLQAECADLVYGRNTFVLFVMFSGIMVRFRRRAPSGFTPVTTKPFLESLPDFYRIRIRKAVVHVDHVDSYTGMIKFNVSGKGLAHGLRRQVQRLVFALQPPRCHEADHCGDNGSEDRHLAKVTVRVSNGNAVSAGIHSRFNGAAPKVSDDIEEMLEPLGHLCGVRYARVLGAVNEDFALQLEARMQSTEIEAGVGCDCNGGMADSVLDEKPVQLCVYGNDI